MMRSKKLINAMTLAGLIGTLGLWVAAPTLAADPGLGASDKASAMHGGHRSGGGKHHGVGFGGMGSLRGLDLSDDQRSQIRTIMQAGWAQSADRRAELQALREALDASVKANGFNEAEVRVLVNARTPLMADLMVDTVRTMAEVRAVLTPEQQLAFDARQAERKAKRGTRSARKGPVSGS